MTRVREIRFTPASDALRRRGTEGWTSFDYGDLRLDGVKVRQNGRGGYALDFPKHLDGNGIPHSYFRPLDQAARESIERQVLDELRHRGDLPSPHSRYNRTSGSGGGAP